MSNNQKTTVIVDAKTGLEDWLEVRGQQFTYDEAREAADFADLIASWELPPDELLEFLNEDKIKLGHKLFIAENIPVEKLSVIMLKEDDDRIMRVAKHRLEANNSQNQSKIILS